MHRTWVSRSASISGERAEISIIVDAGHEVRPAEVDRSRDRATKVPVRIVGPVHQLRGLPFETHCELAAISPGRARPPRTTPPIELSSQYWWATQVSYCASSAACSIVGQYVPPPTLGEATASPSLFVCRDAS